MNINALFQQAVTCFQQGRLAEAADLVEKLLGEYSGHADANHLSGIIAGLRGQYDLACQRIRRAIEINPGQPEYHFNLGLALHSSGELQEALVTYQETIRLDPGHARAYCNSGHALKDLGRLEEAVAAYDDAVRLQSEYAEAYTNRGIALYNLGRLQEALVDCERAIQINPDYPEAHNNHGVVLYGLNRLKEASSSYHRVLELKPDHLFAFGNYVEAKRRICDWSNLSSLHRQLADGIRQGRYIISPFTALLCPTTPGEQLQCARQYIKNRFPVPFKPLCKSPHPAHDRIRIGYLSADFNDHATAHLMAELFEIHDRSKFEVIAISYGPDDQSDMWHRLQRAFDQFVDVRYLGDADAARQIRDLEIDIAVDLKGLTGESRPGILAHRPAPVQVNYLGFPGTMGADFIDYILVDPVIAPAGEQQCFSERFVQLPECYQVNDSRKRIAAHTPTREECGLPEQGVVFCCFNNNYKITPEFFDIWMRLLKAVEGSVLWLFQGNEWVEENLRAEAQERGVDSARLVFAPRMTLEKHLARHRQADLFLDTQPYNAHTTASDALWTGLPVVTCEGTTFAGRVASSLLQAVGLSELVTRNLEDYEALALGLASEPLRLAALKAVLEQNRLSAPLFDTERFRHHLELAYTGMWDLYRRGEKPQAFSVEALQE